MKILDELERIGCETTVAYQQGNLCDGEDFQAAYWKLSKKALPSLIRVARAAQNLSYVKARWDTCLSGRGRDELVSVTDELEKAVQQLRELGDKE